MYIQIVQYEYYLFRLSIIFINQPANKIRKVTFLPSFGNKKFFASQLMAQPQQKCFAFLFCGILGRTLPGCLALGGIGSRTSSISCLLFSSNDLAREM